MVTNPARNIFSLPYNDSFHNLGTFLGGVITSPLHVYSWDVEIYELADRTYLLFNDIQNLLVYRADVTSTLVFFFSIYRNIYLTWVPPPSPYSYNNR